MTKNPEWPGISFIVVINLAFVLIGLLLFESFFGRWFDSNSFGDLTVPVSQPYAVDTTGFYPGSGAIRYHTDENGFRGTHTAVEDIAVLTVGGSTTHEGLIANGETWSDILAAELTAAIGHHVGVANAGMDGQSTFGHLKAFDEWFPKISGLKPKFVIAFVGINDQAKAEPIDVYDDFTARTASERLRYFIRNNSALYDLYRRARAIYRSYFVARVAHGARDILPAEARFYDLPIKTIPGVEPLSEDMLGDHGKEIDAYRSRLNALIRKIRALGADAIIVNQTRGDVSVVENRIRFRDFPGARIEELLKAYGVSKLFAEATLQECRRAKATCIDLASELQLEIEDRYDLVHTTPVGSKKIGRYLARALFPMIADDLRRGP